MCELIVERAAPLGAVVVVNDRADLARLSGADGVHVGQDDLPPADVRRIVGGNAIVGYSTHSIDQVRDALRLPVSYLAVGPVFGTSTKQTGYTAVGLDLVREARALVSAARIDMPIVAIGGITLENAASVVDAGASCVAVISDLLAGGHPANRVREYLTSLK